MDTRKLTVLLLLLVMGMSLGVLAAPFGAVVNEQNSTSANPDSAGTDAALAGNVTELTLTGVTVTRSWQGYYGNVSGTITLENAAGDVLYNWSLASPEGEVYASTNSSIGWSAVQCLNFTANGSYQGDLGNGGAVSQGGINLTQLESRFNILSDDVDGVNETFTLQHGGAGEHDLFYTGSLQFSEGECISTRVYGDGGTALNNEFEEVLLYEPSTQSVIFVAILDEDLLGYDNDAHDFEMLVLEDGHGTDTTTTTYNFYVELE